MQVFKADGKCILQLHFDFQNEHGDSSMNRKSTNLHELGSVLEPLRMALGLDMGKVL